MPVSSLALVKSTVVIYLDEIVATLPETNGSRAENRPSETETSIPTIHFQGRTVSFREGKWWFTLIFWFNVHPWVIGFLRGGGDSPDLP